MTHFDMPELLEAFRKSNSQYRAAEALDTTQQTEVWKVSWQEALDKGLVEKASPAINSYYVLTRKGVKLLAESYEEEVESE